MNSPLWTIGFLFLFGVLMEAHSLACRRILEEPLGQGNWDYVEHNFRPSSDDLGSDQVKIEKAEFLLRLFRDYGAQINKYVIAQIVRTLGVEESVLLEMAETLDLQFPPDGLHIQLCMARSCRSAGNREVRQRLLDAGYAEVDLMTEGPRRFFSEGCSQGCGAPIATIEGIRTRVNVQKFLDADESVLRNMTVERLVDDEFLLPQ